MFFHFIHILFVIQLHWQTFSLPIWTCLGKLRTHAQNRNNIGNDISRALVIILWSFCVHIMNRIKMHHFTGEHLDRCRRVSNKVRYKRHVRSVRIAKWKGLERTLNWPTLYKLTRRHRAAWKSLSARINIWTRLKSIFQYWAELFAWCLCS